MENYCIKGERSLPFVYFIGMFKALFCPAEEGFTIISRFRRYFLVV